MVSIIAATALGLCKLLSRSVAGGRDGAGAKLELELGMERAETASQTYTARVCLCESGGAEWVRMLYLSQSGSAPEKSVLF